MKKVFLHIGLHKTATSHLQYIFNSNRDALGRAGIGYVPTMDFRQQVTVPLSTWHKIKAGEVARYFDENLFQSTLLLSDENLLGHIENYSISGTPYPGMRRNIRSCLKVAGKDRQPVILIAFRNYGAWLESCYLQYQKREGAETFVNFLKRVRMDRLSWPNMIRDLQAAVPNSTILAWSYELYCRDSSVVINCLQKELGVDFILKEGKLSNPSNSELAQRVLQATSGMYNSKEDFEKMQKFLKKHFSSASGYKKPFLFDAEAKKQLGAKYAEDCARIQEMASNSDSFRWLDMEEGEKRNPQQECASQLS